MGCISVAAHFTAFKRDAFQTCLSSHLETAAEITVGTPQAECPFGCLDKPLMHQDTQFALLSLLSAVFSL
jgi:hypothetical protein